MRPKTPYSKAAVDALLDKMIGLKQECENLKTAYQNAQNCLAALVAEHGDKDEIHLSNATFLSATKDEFALTWHKDETNTLGKETYLLKLNRG